MLDIYLVWWYNINMKSIYQIKSDQIWDILTNGMNSVYSDEMLDERSNELLFDLKNKFCLDLADFEDKLAELKEEWAQSRRNEDARNEALDSLVDHSQFENNSDRL
jgi:hypothetical protein